MGFALWIEEGMARCAGAHEYRPMGVAVIASTDLFHARDFNPRVRPPSRELGTFRGLFASLNDVNHYLSSTRGRPARRVSGRILTLLGTLALGAAACAQSPEAHSRDEAGIRAARQASNDAMQRRDVAGFTAALDADYTMVRGNGTAVSSRQAYVELFTRDFADPKSVRFQRVPEKIEISKAAPLAAEHGRWTGRRPDGSLAYSGTYLAMWRRHGSGWKIRSELFVVLDCADEAACAAYRQR